MKDTLLCSRQNPRIKYVRRLAQRRFRGSEGRFIIEGVRFLEEAVNVNWPLDTVLYTPRLAGSRRGSGLLERLAERGITTLAVDEALFAELAETESPQGVLAVARVPRQPDFDPGDCGPGGPGLLLLVDGVQDPGNLGTIIRCADAAGADGVLVLKGTVDPFNPKTLRSTMGSVFHVPLVMVNDRPKLLQDLSRGGWTLVVGDPAAEKPLSRCNLTGRVVLAIGSEAEGVGDDVRQAGEPASIPMPGRAESLNAGVAAGIMLYEALRQRTEFARLSG